LKRFKDLPINERPREKLLENGAKFLSDQELLAVILGKGSKKDDVFSLSEKLIKIIDDKGLIFLPEDILSIDGIGPAQAATISAVFEFVRRRIKPEG
jgi:DNA repair protein RadC